MKYRYSDFCVCPECRGDLDESEDALRCAACGRDFEIRNDIPDLLPSYDDERRERYQENYERVAKNFFATNKYAADNVAHRHHALLKFAGRDHRGKRVLDIGSSHAAYLREIDAELRVAFDIARTHLEKAAPADDLVRVQGDAEFLPFKAGFFDIVIIADILEHLLHPEKLVEILAAISTPATQILVHIPWEENLEPYANSEFEFTHLRSFNAYTHAQLWHRFEIRRSQSTFPDLRYPLIFALERRLPRFLFNALTRRYFLTAGVSEREAARRQRRFEALPRGERWLLWFFKAVFRQFEMRLRPPVEPWWSKMLSRLFGGASKES